VAGDSLGRSGRLRLGYQRVSPGGCAQRCRQRSRYQCRPRRSDGYPARHSSGPRRPLAVCGHWCLGPSLSAHRPDAADDHRQLGRGLRQRLQPAAVRSRTTGHQYWRFLGDCHCPQRPPGPQGSWCSPGYLDHHDRCDLGHRTGRARRYLAEWPDGLAHDLPGNRAGGCTGTTGTDLPATAAQPGQGHPHQ